VIQPPQPPVSKPAPPPPPAAETKESYRVRVEFFRKSNISRTCLNR
jgi:hypothetical protein